MLTIEKLREFGANVEEGVSRCCNMEDFYLRMVEMVRMEAKFDILRQAISENDLQKAFEAAHGLKGVLGNLSLTPLYEPVAEITELLRVQQKADYATMADKILEKRDEFLKLFED